MDINTDELNKIQSKSRDEIVAQVRKQLEVHANNTLKRHSIEADSLYFEQVCFYVLLQGTLFKTTNHDL
jgi:hypothetical protein